MLVTMTVIMPVSMTVRMPLTRIINVSRSSSLTGRRLRDRNETVEEAFSKQIAILKNNNVGDLTSSSDASLASSGTSYEPSVFRPETAAPKQGLERYRHIRLLSLLAYYKKVSYCLKKQNSPNTYRISLRQSFNIWSKHFANKYSLN